MIESAPTMPQARVAPRGPGSAASVLGGRRRSRGSAATGALLEPLPQHAGRGSARAARRCGCRRRSRAARARRCARGLPVAGERGDDRAHLLVAGEQQEGRRAAVALHADDVEAGVGVARARRRRAAAPSRSECRFGSISGASARGASTRSSRSRRSSREQREVGPEAGGRDHLVGDELDASRRRSSTSVRRAASRRARLEAGDERDARRRRPARARRGPSAPRAGQLVVAVRRRTCRPGAPPRIAQTICVAGRLIGAARPGRAAR